MSGGGLATNTGGGEIKPYLVIKPKKGWQLIDFRELKEYRDLFYFLVARDVKIRYKQTVLGGLWAVIQPLFMMIVFTLFFGRLAGIPSDGVPYPIFNYTAMVIWTYFAGSVTFSSNSLVQENTLISKVYFPRLMVPLAPVIALLLDFAIALVLLAGMMIVFRVYPGPEALLVPILLLLLVLTASGTGMFLAALNAKYRDIRYTLTFLLQFWMFASPVVYPASILPEKYHLLYAINPMAGIIEGFRSALLGTTAFPFLMVLISGAVGIIIFVGGALYFKQTERNFADII
ncbi:MAG: ABC transporter permease [Chloroflexi bacterium]|nr:ABC transporter permease [Chloroflexota bacterium]